MSYTEVSGFRILIIQVLFIVLMCLGFTLFSNMFSPALGGLFVWLSVLTYLLVSFIKKELIIIVAKFPSFRYGGNRSRWTSGLFLLAVIILGILYQPNLEDLKTPYVFLVVMISVLVGYVQQRLLSKYVIIDHV